MVNVHYNILNDSGFAFHWSNQTNVPLNIPKTVKLELTEMASLFWKEAGFILKVKSVLIFLNKIFIFEYYINILPDDLS